MNKNIKNIIAMPSSERREVFDSGARCMSVSGELSPKLIEKDFWVCAVLDAMFNNISPEYEHDELFLFKGGTSLSKCFNKIDRFSEDIDIVVSRQFLGFSGESDPLSPDGKFDSKNKQRKAIEALAVACSEYILGDFKRQLEAIFPMANITLDDSDMTTLHVEYPSCYSKKDYIRSAVKIEAGAKSAVIPSAHETVEPYISRLPDLNLNLTISGIHSISPERTFMDKLLILHGWNKGVLSDLSRLPNPENRLSRHYYDVAKLWDSELTTDVLLMEDLFTDVREHNVISGFNRKWMETKDVTLQTLDIRPNSDLIKVLKRDYSLMQSMLFGDVPKFDWILETIDSLDTTIKARNKSLLQNTLS